MFGHAKIVAILLLLVAVAIAKPQFDGFFGRAGNFGPQPGGPNGPDSTGPIVFPMSPNSPDTSGVVVGASGYGFVPPGTQGVGRNVPRQSLKRRPFGRFF